MKKLIYLLCLLVSIVTALSPTTIYAQHLGSQRGVITWQKNGDINALLYSDIDSITYSKVDLNGHMHSNVVVQEIWTPDSLYRIPINSIDSIALKAPAPVYNESIFHIRDFHYPFVTDVTDSTVTFDASIPSDSLPNIGQVVISERAYIEPFLHGFSGRVVRIDNLDGRVCIVCEKVALEDIFEKLFCFGKAVSINEDSIVNRTPNNRTLDIIDEEGYTTFSIKKLSFNIAESGASHISLGVTPTIAIDYLVHIGIGTKDRFKFVVHNTMTCDFGFFWDKSFDVIETYYPYEPLTISIVPEIGLNAFINLGGYVNLQGSADLGVKRVVILRSQVGYDSDYQGLDTEHKGLRLHFDDPDWRNTEGYANFNAEISAGPALKVGACIVDEDLASVNLTLEVGPKLKGKLGFSTNSATVYNEHLTDSIEFKPLTAILLGGVDVLGHKKDWPLAELPLANWFEKFKARILHLFPKFTAPYAPDMNDYGAPYALTTDITRNLIFPVRPGISLYQNGSLVDTIYSSVEYKRQDGWNNSYLNMDLINIYNPGTYTAKPIFKFFGKTVVATDSSSITIPAAPIITANPKIINFGEVLIGNTVTKTITVRGVNLNDNISVSSDSQQFTVNQSTLPASGGVVQVTFSPQTLGYYSGIITISGGGAESKTVRLSATGVQPSLTANPNPANIGNVEVGKSGYIDVSVTGKYLQEDISLEGISNETEGGEFSITRILRTSLGNSVNEKYRVTYNPARAHSSSAQFTFKSGNLSVKVTVNAKGIGTITTSPTSLAFGNVPKGYPATKTINVTGMNLTGNITVASNNPNFTVNKSTLSATGGNVSVTFNATTLGSYSGAIIISGGGAESKTVSVTATCVQPSLTANPNPANIGNVVVGTSGFVNITMTGVNLPGNINLGSNWSETESGEFSISRISQTTNGSTVTAVYKVTYKPARAHSSSAQFTFTSGNLSVKVTVNGKGVVPTITVNPTSLAFNNVNVGSVNTQTFTVTGTNLTSNAVLVIKGTNAGMFSINTTSITPAQAAAGYPVKVTYSPTSKGSHTATITVSSNGAASKNVSLSGTAILGGPSPY